MPTSSPGWWLQVVAVLHTGVGVVLYRDALADIADAKVVMGSAAMPLSGFWGLAAVGLGALRRSMGPK
jgi:hypothetical protein